MERAEHEAIGKEHIFINTFDRSMLQFYRNRIFNMDFSCCQCLPNPDHRFIRQRH